MLICVFREFQQVLRYFRVYHILLTSNKPRCLVFIIFIPMVKTFAISSTTHGGITVPEFISVGFFIKKGFVENWPYTAWQSPMYLFTKDDMASLCLCGEPDLSCSALSRKSWTSGMTFSSLCRKLVSDLLRSSSPALDFIILLFCSNTWSKPILLNGTLDLLVTKYP